MRRFVQPARLQGLILRSQLIVLLTQGRPSGGPGGRRGLGPAPPAPSAHPTALPPAGVRGALQHGPAATPLRRRDFRDAYPRFPNPVHPLCRRTSGVHHGPVSVHEPSPLHGAPGTAEGTQARPLLAGAGLVGELRLCPCCRRRAPRVFKLFGPGPASGWWWTIVSGEGVPCCPWPACPPPGLPQAVPSPAWWAGASTEGTLPLCPACFLRWSGLVTRKDLARYRLERGPEELSGPDVRPCARTSPRAPPHSLAADPVTLRHWGWPGQRVAHMDTSGSQSLPNLTPGIPHPASCS